MADPVIEARGLYKNFGTTPVLCGVDLKLKRGDGAAILGSNGAGKSTLAAILAGMAAPSSGRATLFGEDSHRLSPANRRRLGVMTHQSFLYPSLTARENLEFYAALYGLDGPRARAERALERVGLAAASEERARALSRGMEQRLSIARAMLAGPEVLLLDEPFAGLDAGGVAIVTAMIEEAMARGCAVVMTAHATSGLAGLDLDRWELKGGRLVALQPSPAKARAPIGRS